MLDWLSQYDFCFFSNNFKDALQLLQTLLATEVASDILVSSVIESGFSSSGPNWLVKYATEMARLSALSVLVRVHCRRNVANVRAKGRFQTPQARWSNVTFVMDEGSLITSARNVMGEEKLHAMPAADRLIYVRPSSFEASLSAQKITDTFF